MGIPANIENYILDSTKVPISFSCISGEKVMNGTDSTKFKVRNSADMRNMKSQADRE